MQDWVVGGIRVEVSQWIEGGDQVLMGVEWEF